MKNSLFIKLLILLVIILAVSICSYFVYKNNRFDISKIKPVISTGEQSNLHVQGVAIDKKNGYLYYSYTNKIVKSDLEGNIIGSISGFFGHIGCIDYNEDDGKVYASLEYKHDVIGQIVLSGSNVAEAFDDGFYVAIFDVDKITKGDYNISEHPDMMKTVFLPEVLADYKGNGFNKNGEEVPHKYGCSGIDGLCIAPLPGEKSRNKFLYVAYGIYSDVTRDDNDHQVILCYDLNSFSDYAKAFDQKAMHTDGPGKADYRFFVYTGNTEFGVQNMSYDEKSNLILMATYPGAKKEFDNYSLFAIDLTQKPSEGKIKGTNESGLALSLRSSDSTGKKPLSGWHAKLGVFGMCYIDDGYYYLAESIKENGKYSANIYLHRFDTEKGFEAIS
jgi:hypothetical protein